MSSVGRRFQACVVLLLSGCAGTDDSTSVLDTPPETWRLVETARVGSVDGVDDALTRVGAFLPMPDGGAWFVEPVERRVRALDRDGDVSHWIGGPGQGPGEFTIPGTMGWWNGGLDTVWVADEFARTVSLFTSEGDFARSIRMDPIEWEEQWVVGQPSAIGPGSIGLGLARYRQGVEARDRFPLIAFELPSGAPVVEMGSILRTDGVEIRWRGEAVATGAHPLSDAPIVAYSPRGTMIAVVERDADSGQGDPEVHVTTLSPAGDTVWRRSIRYEPKPVPSAELDALWAQGIESLQRFVALEGRFAAEEAEHAYEESVLRPANRPPISAVRMDGAGRLLLTWSAEPEAEADVWVMDALGGLVASFELPARQRVLGFEGDIVWLLELDEMDIPFVIRTRIEGA